jgi:GTP-binding protein
MRFIVTQMLWVIGHRMSLLHTARFLITAVQPSGLPPAHMPEVAFVGRSNAGKSSTLNRLCQQRQMAFASRTPGRTQALNLFAVGPKDAHSGILVDTPGYGYAKVAKSEKREWETLGGHYLLTRQSLVAVVLIADIRRGLTEADQALISFVPNSLPLAVFLTKADKLSYGAQMGVRSSVAAQLRSMERTAEVLPISNLSRDGIEAAQKMVIAWITGQN